MPSAGTVHTPKADSASPMRVLISNTDSDHPITMNDAVATPTGTHARTPSRSVAPVPGPRLSRRTTAARQPAASQTGGEVSSVVIGCGQSAASALQTRSPTVRTP